MPAVPSLSLNTVMFTHLLNSLSRNCLVELVARPLNVNRRISTSFIRCHYVAFEVQSVGRYDYSLCRNT